MKVEINSERWMCLEDLPGERWVKIDVEDSDYYYISNFGRVKNIPYPNSFLSKLKNKVVRILPAAIHPISIRKDGWCKVSIVNRKYYLHKLLATAFLHFGGSNKKQVIVFKDGVRENCYLDNLAVVDTSDRNITIEECVSIISNVCGILPGEMWDFVPNTNKRYAFSNKFRLFSLVVTSNGGRYKLLDVDVDDGFRATKNVSIDSGDHCISLRYLVLSRFGEIKSEKDFDYRPKEDSLSLYLSKYITILDGEIWKYVVDTLDYCVSNRGRIVSMRIGNKTSPGLFVLSKNSSGYPTATINRYGKLKTEPVHRLVAEAFIPNPYNKPVVDHIDTIRDNNNVENLRWVTISENCNNPLSRKHKSEASFGPASLAYRERRKIAVFQYSLSGEMIKKWGCAADVSRKLGFNRSTIRRRCIENDPTPYYGFIWSYSTPQRTGIEKEYEQLHLFGSEYTQEIESP